MGTCHWIIVLLAVPGVAWCFYAACISVTPFFGESPSASDWADARAILLSGAILLTVTAALSGLACHQWYASAVALCLPAIPVPLSSTIADSAPLHLADTMSWVNV